MKHIEKAMAAALAAACMFISTSLMAQTAQPSMPTSPYYEGPSGYQVKGEPDYIRDNIEPSGRVVIRQATESDLWRSKAVGQRKEWDGGGDSGGN